MNIFQSYEKITQSRTRTSGILNQVYLSRTRMKQRHFQINESIFTIEHDVIQRGGIIQIHSMGSSTRDPIY